jgi:hypothetical protein
LISTPLYEKILDAVEDSDGNYYFVGYKAELYSLENCGYLLKTNNSGDIIYENLLCCPDSMLSFNHAIIKYDSLIIFGIKGSVSIGYDELLTTMIFDQNLNSVYSSSKKILPETYYLGGINPKINHLGHYILMGMGVTRKSLEFDIFFYEMSGTFDSIDCKIDIRDYNQVGMDFIENSEQNGYKVFGHGVYPTTTVSYDELVEFDSAFNFISVDTIAWKIKSQHTALYLDDSTYILTGHKSVSSPERTDIGIVKLNKYDELLVAQHFGKGGDTISYAGVNNNVDFVTKDNIYYGGTSNFIVYQWPWQTDNSWLILVNLDSNLNLNWQRFYGGDAFYHLWGLLATQDGGCMMYAVRYDENTQFEEYDVYILKVDSNGLLTSTGEGPHIPINELIIYPNPARDQITVRYPGIFDHREREIIIYNSLGNAMRRIYRHPGQVEEPVDICNLPPGLYIAVLTSDGKRIATGKFVVR